MKTSFLQSFKRKVIIFYLTFFVATSPIWGLTEFLKINAAESIDYTISAFSPPLNLVPNELVELPITLVNTGNETWYRDIANGSPVMQLSYRLRESETGLVIDGEKTELISDVNDVSQSPLNQTDENQTIKILAPNQDGIYDLSITLWDEIAQTYVSASSESVLYTLIVDSPEIPLNPDITNPTGSIEINNGDVTTTSSLLAITLEALDPNVEGDETSGVNSYKIWLDSEDESLAEWTNTLFAPEITREFTIPAVPGTYTVLSQFKDLAGNVSEINSASIDFESVAPTGSVMIDIGSTVETGKDYPEVQDTLLELTLTANGNVPVTHYMVSAEEDFNDTDWVAFESDSLLDQILIIQKEIPDQTGDYEFFVKFKNAYEQESVVYSDAVSYESYDIFSNLEVESADVLFGDTMTLSATVQNTGEDIGYNTRVGIVLPRGFSFIEPLEMKEFQNELSVGGISPTFLRVNEDGNQELVYEGIADLLPGESTEIHARIRVGGLAEGYKLGDIVDFQISSTLYKRINFRTGETTTKTHQAELKPFTVDYTGPGSEDTNGEILVEEVFNNKINIQTNPDIATSEDSEQGLVVNFELGKGLSFILGTDVITIDGIIADIIANVSTTLEENTVLNWVFQNVSVDSLIEIVFQSKIDKVKDTTLEGPEFTEHNDSLETNITVEGEYTNPTPNSCDTVECIPASETYTENESQTITAKYFTVSKSGTPWNTDILTKIRYTVKIQTSSEYKLSGIEISDILPDGVDFTEATANIVQSEDKSLSLHANTVDPVTGEQTLTWRLQDANGLEAGSIYEFSYDVDVKQNYDTKLIDETDNRLFSHDTLISKIEVEGLWTDIDESYIRPETLEERIKTDADWALNRLPVLTYSQGISHVDTPNDWQQSLDVKIGDVVNVYADVTFPITVPTYAFNYRTYIPVGTEIVGDIQVISDISSISTTPIGSCSESCVAFGYWYNAQKVEPGQTFRIEYQLQVLDDANLKEAFVVRNLFRSDYQDIDVNKVEYKADVALTLIEPNIKPQKNVINGYLARGEIATIQVRIQNSGTDAAYGVSFTDTMPSHTQLIDGSLQFPDGSLITYDPETRSFASENLDLAAGESYTFTYQVLVGDNVQYGDNLDHDITISSYKNRSESDPLVARIYEEKTYLYTWKAVEPLAITGFNNTEIGRDESFELEAFVKNVGKAPIYNGNITIDLSEISALTSDLSAIPYTVKVNGSVIEAIITESEGIYTLENITVGANDTVSVHFSLQSPRLVAMGTEYPVEIIFTGNDALGDSIRKDGYQQQKADTDNDDKTSTEITIVKRSAEPITGSISLEIDGENVAVTNQPRVDAIRYTIDQPNRVVAVRFSNNIISWYAHQALPQVSDEIKTIFDLEGGWSEWSFGSAQDDNTEFYDDCSVMPAQCTLNVEGDNYRYMQVIDLQGDVYTFNTTILKDTKAPRDTVFSISPFANDYSNPVRTATFENYLNFYSYDQNSLENYSDLGFFKYCLVTVEISCASNEGWSEWQDMDPISNSIPVIFEEVEPGGQLKAFLQVKDKAGNVYLGTISDTIIYSTKALNLSVTLNDNANYTNEPAVNTKLSINGGSTVKQIRFSESDLCNPAEQNCSLTEWQSFDGITEFTRMVHRSWEDGKKQICAQIQDEDANISNIACDTINLDRVAPIGFMLINNNDSETNSRNITLNILADDPELPDGTPGAGGIEMRFSLFEDNCEYIANSIEKEICESQWTNWETYSSEKSWELLNKVGQQTIYIQFKDAVGNISDVNNASVNYNPYTGTGNIIINNNDLFTNSKNVNLDLTVDTNILCENCSEPVLMRLYQQIADEQPQWGDWMEYTSSLQWDLDKNNMGRPNYGIKTVYVQYKLPNTQETEVYSDSIIYAPYYAVQYFNQDGSAWSSSTSSVNGNISSGQVVTLNTIADNAISQDNFYVKLQAQNIGSFTWPAKGGQTEFGDQPVRITYTWKRVGGAIDPSWPIELVNQEFRGNSVILPDNIAWQENTGELTLKVDTPVFPGEYELVIDTVHESKAWFKDFANDAPTYKISISQNAEKPLPELDLGDVLGSNRNIGGEVPVQYSWEADGWGHNCADTWNNNHNRLCYIQGIWNVNRNTNYQSICANYGGYYQYEIETGGKRFNFCPGNTGYWDQFLGTQMTAQVKFQPNGQSFNIWGLAPARKFWKSELYQSDNDSRLFSPIIVNRSTPAAEYTFTLQPRFRNTGTGIWQRNATYLIAVDRNGNEINSPFRGSNWASGSRVHLDNNGSGWGQGALVPFTMNIRVPETMAWGLYEQCFKVGQDGIGFERSDMLCIRFDVQMTYQERRTYVCAQPHNVYINKDDTSEVIGQIQQNTEFIIKGEDGDWSLIYFPFGDHQEGWIKNDLACFDGSEIIENIIPAPVFPILPEPTGDTGNVIILEGIQVKNGPADGFDTIATIPYGAKVQVLAEAFIEDHKYGGWLLVRLEDGTEGWVPKGTIQHVNDPVDIQVNLRPTLVRGHVCGAEEVPVYSFPGVKTTVVATLQRNQNIPVIKTWQNWHQIYINANGDTGWIESLQVLCSGYVYPKENYCGTGDIGYPFEKEWRYTSYFRSATRPTHNAVDIGAPYGTPILAATSGNVIGYSTEGWNGGPAKFVKIKNDQMQVQTGYWHLSSVADTVFDGWVEKGEVIGYVGNTGNSTGPHLHFYVFDYKLNDYIDPIIVMGSTSAGTCDVNSGTLSNGDLPYSQYSDDDIAEELMDEEMINSDKMMFNWNIDPAEFPSWAGFRVVKEKATIDGKELEFTIPEVRTGKRDETFGIVSILNPTDKRFDISNLSFLSDPQHWVYKNFFLENTDTGQRHYFNDYSRAPSWWAGNVGEFFLTLKDPLVISDKDIINTYYFRGTIKRLHKKFLWMDSVYPEKGEYFNLQLWRTEHFDMENSDLYFTFKIGDHVNEEEDLWYSFDANEFWNDILPGATCILGSVVFTAGAGLVVCIGLPGAKILSQGYVAPEDAINIGSELLFFGVGKIIKLGFKAAKPTLKSTFSQLASTGVGTALSKTTAIKATEKAIARLMAKRSMNALSKELSENGVNRIVQELGQESVETQTKNILSRTSIGILRESMERQARNIPKSGTVLRPMAEDLAQDSWKFIMGNSYDQLAKLPKTSVKGLNKGIIFDGFKDGIYYEMKNYVGKVNLTYQIRLEIFQALKSQGSKGLTFITPNGVLDDLAQPLQNLIAQVNLKYADRGFKITVEKFITNL